MNMLQPVIAGVLFLLLAAACNKPTFVGSDLLDGDQIFSEFTDTFTLKAYTVIGDSVQVYDPARLEQLRGYLFGRFDDPVFGTSTATISMQLVPPTTKPIFNNAQIDSVVLTLAYFPSAFYGDTTETYEMEVFRLDEVLSGDEPFYSNRLPEKGDLLGGIALLPRPFDSLTILQHSSGDQVRISPMVRIRLDDAFGQSILDQDTSVFSTDAAFFQFFPGVQIAPKAGASNKGLISFSLRSGLTQLVVYYREEGEPKVYPFTVGTKTLYATTFEHDYSQVGLQAFLDQPELGDSLLFLQAMRGLNPVFEFPYITQLKQKIINRAELELTVMVLPDENGYINLEPVRQIVASQRNSNGQLFLVEDARLGLVRDDISFVFGGVPITGTPITYKLNLSAALKEIKNGSPEDKIILSVFLRSELASRVVLCGPGHSVYPAKLKLSFTEI
jgi:hypothetical protein